MQKYVVYGNFSFRRFKMIESLVHQTIMENRDVKFNILEILDLEISGKFNFLHEHRIDNNLIIDFAILFEGEIAAMIECKGSNLTGTDFVRGLGQCAQYKAILEKPHFLKGYTLRPDFKVALLFPSSILSTKKISLSNYQIPENILLLEINETTHFIRQITEKEIHRISKSQESPLVTISHYYFRDNRIYELYILLRYTGYKRISGCKRLERSLEEQNFLRLIGTHNNRNWRNAFITLSSLGLIDINNLATRKGMALAYEPFEDFAIEILNAYMYNYFVEIICVFQSFSGENIDITNDEISEIIREKYGKDVLYLTESDNRYISSWLNIMRDDFGCIDFKARQSKRIIRFNPLELNSRTLKYKIKKYTKAYTYIQKYEELLGGV
jgi:hypothetical protein